MASGVLTFQGTRGLASVYDTIYLRVYWSTSAAQGGDSSTLTIDRVTVQSKDYSYGGNFFYDGIITINGETVLSASMQATEVVTISKDAETTLPFSSVSRTISQPGGASASATIGVNKRPGTNYNYFTLYNPTYNTYTSYVRGEQSITIPNIPQARTVTLNPGAGSWITVNGSSTSPQTFYDGDTINISGGADAGYDFGGLSVNGAAFAGGSYQVTQNLNITSSATRKTYTLTYTAPHGSVPITRDGVTLTNGATLYWGDVVNIGEPTADIGYTVTNVQINTEAAATVPTSVTITRDLIVYVHTHINLYNISPWNNTGVLNGQGGVRIIIGGVVYTETQVVEYGTQVELQAVPADGYKFKRWDVYGTYYRDNPTSFVAGIDTDAMHLDTYNYMIAFGANFDLQTCKFDWSSPGPDFLFEVHDENDEWWSGSFDSIPYGTKLKIRANGGPNALDKITRVVVDGLEMVYTGRDDSGYFWWELPDLYTVTHDFTGTIYTTARTFDLNLDTDDKIFVLYGYNNLSEPQGRLDVENPSVTLQFAYSQVRVDFYCIEPGYKMVEASVNDTPLTITYSKNMGAYMAGLNIETPYSDSYLLRGRSAPAGAVRIHDGNAFQMCLPKVYTDGEWKAAVPYVYRNGEWVIST